MHFQRLLQGMRQAAQFPRKVRDRLSPPYSSIFPGALHDRAGAAGTALAQPDGSRRQAAGNLGAGRARRLRHGRARQLLPEPAAARSHLYRPLAAGCQPHRRGAQGGGHRLRRQFPGYGRAGALRADGAGAHASGRERPAQQRQRRLRAVRQAGLHGPHLVHAGDHPGAGARRRDRAHHPGDEGREGCPRAYRAAGHRLISPQPPSPFRLRDRAHGIRRRFLLGAGH